MSNATILLSFFTNFFLVLFIIAVLNKSLWLEGERNEYWKKRCIMGIYKFITCPRYKCHITPGHIKILNSAELGVWYTFTSLYGLAMLIDFGFQTIITRNVSYLWSGAQNVKSEGFETVKDENAKMNIQYFIKVISAVKFIYTSMGTIIFALFISIGTWYMVTINNGEIKVETMLISWAFYMISIVLNISFRIGIQF